MTPPGRVELAAGREYFLYRPLWPARPPAVVVFLHGTGGTAEWAADEANLPAFAADHGFVLAVPQALRPRPDEPPKFLTNPARWNDGSAAAVPDMQSTADDVAFLRGVIADATLQTAADPARVYVWGFSNGAGMAFRLAAEASETVAAAVPVAGFCWTRVKPARPVPLLYIVGDADPLIPARGGVVKLPWGNTLVRRPGVVATLETWADLAGHDATSEVEADTPGGRVERYPGPAELRLVTLPGHGHHWPGGKGQLNPRIGGPNATAFDANVAAWAFCRRHGLHDEKSDMATD